MLLLVNWFVNPFVGVQSSRGVNAGPPDVLREQRRSDRLPAPNHERVRLPQDRVLVKCNCLRYPSDYPYPRDDPSAGG